MDTVIAVGVRILETIFMVGLVGSGIVLLMTMVEDAKSLLPGDDKKETEPATHSGPQVHAHHTVS